MDSVRRGNKTTLPISTGSFIFSFRPTPVTWLPLFDPIKFRFRVKVDGMTVGETENTMLALDLSTLKPVSTGGD